jgi:hypothetical protein
LNGKTHQFEGIDMTQTIQIGAVDQASAFDAPTSVDGVKIVASSDGNTLTIAIADFVANPASYTRALEAIPRRPIHLQFV